VFAEIYHHRRVSIGIFQLKIGFDPEKSFSPNSRNRKAASRILFFADVALPLSVP